MEKMLFTLVLFSLSAAHATEQAAPKFDENRLARRLPPGWSIVAIRKDQYPYGFLEDAGTRGLCISLSGPTEVLDKRRPVRESLSVWLMPLDYPAASVPAPGTPHRPARLIGKGESYAAFALPWTETPSWKTWQKDLQLILAVEPPPPPAASDRRLGRRENP